MTLRQRDIDPCRLVDDLTHILIDIAQVQWQNCACDAVLRCDRPLDVYKRQGERGKQVLGLALLSLGALILFHADHRLEAWLLDHSPAWLTALTTQY